MQWPKVGLFTGAAITGFGQDRAAGMADCLPQSGRLAPLPVSAQRSKLGARGLGRKATSAQNILCSRTIAVLEEQAATGGSLWRLSIAILEE